MFCAEGSFLSDSDDRDGRLDEPAGPWGDEQVILPLQASLRFDTDVTSIGVPLRLELEAQRQETPPQAAHKTASASAAVISVASTGTEPRRLPGPHRRALVLWMGQAAAARGLQLATLFSAVGIMDRFVAAAKDNEVPPETMLQLMALACMSLATKYHEGSRLPLSSWICLAIDPDGQPLYEAPDLTHFEVLILRALGWRPHRPSAADFLHHYLCCARAAAAASNAADGVADGRVKSAVTAAAEARPGSPSPAAAATGGACAQADGRLRDVASAAAALAELSLQYDAFLSYDASTTALACFALAERLVAAAGAPASAATAAASAAIADPAAAEVAAGAGVVASVSRASGLPLDALAPGFEPCMSALAQCYCWAAAQPQ
ncbi:CYCD1.3 protein [Gonium pectorale]|uniref:CYCD1.3 protein n=1 Tax=Gonium pectorale TaxID=33097 RepID=A0A150G834_GONPE|nr:CYCD1.3 protein [Gonium pectorale]|eukprot:KXZ46026.1 CYCD1.3 protein [Gonium pectorale]